LGFGTLAGFLPPLNNNVARHEKLPLSTFIICRKNVRWQFIFNQFPPAGEADLHDHHSTGLDESTDKITPMAAMRTPWVNFLPWIQCCYFYFDGVGDEGVNR